jgi:serine protein kinase
MIRDQAGAWRLDCGEFAARKSCQRSCTTLVYSNAFCPDMPISKYLEPFRGDPMRYANAAERIWAAIGEPQMIDTAKDPRLGRIFLNRTIRAYPAFAGFYGMEETIERIVSFFRHAAQGLEERLAERLKSLMEVHPIYVLKAGDELSPVFENPLGLFDPEAMEQTP